MNFTEGYSRAEIQKLLGQLPNPVHKLYVNFEKDAGFRANDTLYVRYKHVQRDFEAGQKYVHVKFEEERYKRRKAPGRSFIGPNTVDLLRQLFDKGTLSRAPEAKLFNFSYRNIVKVIDRAKKEAGLRPEIQPSHGLRKFFEGCLDRTGMDHNKKLQLEGHSNGVRNAYTSRDIDELRGLYEQAYRFLDLSEDSVVSNELKALQAKINEQENTIRSLKEERADSAELRNVIQTQQKLVVMIRELARTIDPKQPSKIDGILEDLNAIAATLSPAPSVSQQSKSVRVRQESTA